MNTRLRPYLGWLGFGLLTLLALVTLYYLRGPEKIAVYGWSAFLVVGFLGVWRWGWLLIQLARFQLYSRWVFPKWRAQADALPDAELPPLCIIIPTFKEKDWITDRVFKAITRECVALPYPTTLILVTTPAENIAIKALLHSDQVDPRTKDMIRLVQLEDKAAGKRGALADGLTVAQGLGLPANTVIALMDGDVEIRPGTLIKSLPFFAMFPNLGGLTTDEFPEIHGSYLFSEWFHLRFIQRHYQMCCMSLSKRVTCLTGRFSVFRGQAALDPSFTERLRNDFLDDWLWGKFKFLSGDDKSTWYWVLSHGYDMMYLPDVMVDTIDVIDGSLPQRIYQNMRRWFGNMLRNRGRTLALGPKRTGWYLFFVLIDQQVSIWTSLIVPSSILVGVLQQN